jgi:hypothetical protein
MSKWPCTGEEKGEAHGNAYPPERPCAVSLLGRMGDWTCDRNREPAHLAEHSVLGRGQASRHPVISFIVGVLIALLIAAGAFILLVSQQ